MEKILIRARIKINLAQLFTTFGRKKETVMYKGSANLTDGCSVFILYLFNELFRNVLLNYFKKDLIYILLNGTH